MAHPVEEGSGAPSFRPLWRLMPYLWPKGRPVDVRYRAPRPWPWYGWDWGPGWWGW